MDIFAWRDSYSVGVAEIDNQHQALFKLVNELHVAVSTGRGADTTKAVLLRLVAYTQTHFAAEERLLAKHRFPGLDAHRQSHEEFTRQLTQFLCPTSRNATEITQSVLQMLQHWLMDHVTGVDQQCAVFFVSPACRNLA